MITFDLVTSIQSSIKQVRGIRSESFKLDTAMQVLDFPKSAEASH